MDSKTRLRSASKIGALWGIILASLPAMAQEQAMPTQQVGQVAESSAGQVGQRQTREQAPANIKPMARIDDRIANRVQNRIRSRIDRFYNPLANTASPFETAADQIKKSSSQTRP